MSNSWSREAYTRHGFRTLPTLYLKEEEQLRFAIYRTSCLPPIKLPFFFTTSLRSFIRTEHYLQTLNPILSTKINNLMDLPPLALISGLEKFPAEIYYPAPLFELWKKCTKPKLDHTTSSGYNFSLNPYIYHLMEVKVIERLKSIKSWRRNAATGTKATNTRIARWILSSGCASICNYFS